jgi:hypothetical protein
VSYISTLSSSITTINTNKLNFASQGTTATGTGFSASITATNNTTYGEATFATRTATFASVDQARYFFNAGGKLSLYITSVTNNDSTARSTDAATIMGTSFGNVKNFGATTNSGMGSGAGATFPTNSTTTGYYGLTSANVLYFQATTSSSTYSGDFVKLYMKTDGATGSNAANGSTITFYLNYYSAHTSTTSGTYGSSGDTLNVTVNHRIDVIYPETTNLTANTWGAVTIA